MCRSHLGLNSLISWAGSCTASVLPLQHVGFKEAPQSFSAVKRKEGFPLVLRVEVFGFGFLTEKLPSLYEIAFPQIIKKPSAVVTSSNTGAGSQYVR